MNGDPRTGSHLAFGGNFAACLANDRVNARKTQTRTFRFCGVEGLENSRENFRRHPATCVDHSHADTWNAGVLVRRFDAELSAAWHGIARIQNKIDEDLLELRRIHVDIPDIGRELYDELNILTDQSGKKLCQLTNCVLGGQQPWVDDLFFAEAE